MATPTTLPAAFVAGDVLTAAQQNALRGAFRILQVVYASTTTSASSTTTTFATTNLSATITPSATSSKVLILANVQTTSNAVNQFTGLRIFNGTSALLTNNRALMQPAAGDIGTMCSLLYLDSPNTTSAVTYTIQFARTSGGGTSIVQSNSEPSTIIVCEVSA
jgi:hypothetical protein